jgi:zinc/manganese transport system substrate-binding protein
MLLVSGVVSCGRDVPPPARPGKLRVLTSFLPVQSHTAAIAGDLAEVTQLLSADAGPHDFQLTPGVVKRLAEADVFIVNGAGLEDWLDELIANAGRPGLMVVDVSAALPLTENPAAFAYSGAIEEGKNPHTWLDPVLAREQAGVILAALQKADPANAAAYAANAKTYAAQLEALDADFRATLAPLTNKNLVTFHDAFPYLAARYGLTYVGCISDFPEKDPPPQQLASLVDSIRSAKVSAIFAETGYAPDLLVEIARQSGARVSQLDTLEVGTGHATAYLERMRQNLAALQDAFAP